MHRTQRWIATIGGLALCVLAVAFAIAPSGPLAPDSTANLAKAADMAAKDNGASATLDASGTDAQPPAAPAEAGEDSEADPPYEEGAVLVSLEDSVSLDEARDIIARETGLPDIAVESVTDTCAKVTFGGSTSVRDAVAAISTSEAVASAQPNFTYYPNADEAAQTGTPELTASGLFDLQPQAATTGVNDPKATKWMLDNIDAYAAWNIVAKDKNPKAVTVAVIDLGFRLTHEDFTGNFVYNPKTKKYDKPLFVAPYNAYTNKAGANNLATSDSHGSHVAGIIAAHVNNGKGVAGVTNNMVQIMPVQAFDKTGDKTSTAALIRALDYVVKKADDYNVRVVNMSVGGGTRDDNWDQDDRQLFYAIAKAHDKGIVPVVSAGNVKPNKPKSPEGKAPFYHVPGDFEQCVTVINLYNTDPSKPSMVNRYKTSNYNCANQMVKDISAPGTDIVSAAATGNDKYVEYTGTSMAAPVVSGVFALMFVVDNKLSADEAVSKLYSAAGSLYSEAANLGDPIWSRDFGYGAVNAQHAVSDEEYLSGATSVFAGEKQTYKFNLPNSVKANASDVKWGIYKSVGKDVAKLTSSGKKATITGKKEGSFILVASVKANGRNYRAVQTVTVYDAKIKGPKNLDVGDRERYYTSAAPSISGRDWNWKSSNPAVATVGKGGIVAAKKKGTVTITGTLASNPKITASRKITVKPFNMSQAKDDELSATYRYPVYDGTAQKPKFKVTLNKGEANAIPLVQGKDFKIVYTNNVNAGKSAHAKLVALPGSVLCSGSCTLDFTIRSASIEDAKITDVANRKYTGSTVKAQNPTVKLGKKALKLRRDFAVSYQNAKGQAIAPSNVKAKGKYFAVITGKGNYAGTVKKAFRVA